MTKKQVIWLIIRLVGVWFCWEALNTTATVLGTLTLMADLESGQQVVTKATSGMAFIQIVLGGVLKLVVGVYCVGGGEFLFSLLNREPDHFDLDEYKST